MIETADTDYDNDYERLIISWYFDRKSEKITNFPMTFFLVLDHK